MTPLRAEDIQAVTFLQEQGDHFVLLHNAPGTDRHKAPLWYKYQLPRNRPSLRQCLDHLEAGGLLGHIPASLGLAVVDVDESDPDGLFDWMSRYRPLGDVPSQRAGRVHLYYDARAGWGNKNGRRLRRYGMKVDVRCMGMVAIWDLSAVAEIAAQRAMALKPGRSLPKTVLGLTERPKPPEWGGTPPPEREIPPPPRRPVMGASGAYQWQCPAPPGRAPADRGRRAQHGPVRRGEEGRIPVAPGQRQWRRAPALGRPLGGLRGPGQPDVPGAPGGARGIQNRGFGVPLDLGEPRVRQGWRWRPPGPGGAVQAGAVERRGAPAAGKAQERADRRAAPAGRPGPAGHRPDYRGLAEHGLENGSRPTSWIRGVSQTNHHPGGSMVWMERKS